MKKKILFGVAGVLIVFGLISSLTGGGKKEETIQQQETATVEETKEKVSAEALAALGKAELYATTMFMSKKAIYSQLISEAEGFGKEDAQYAIDNVVADWNNNALEKAKIYQETMNMSRKSIYEQLVSEAEGFTKEEADYALKNLPQ